jgi:leucyl aminopeptidase (aminopeptidase T)
LTSKQAEVLLATCAGLKRSERLFIVSDSSTDKNSVESIESAAKNLGVQVVTEILDGEPTREPPTHTAEQMLENAVSILCVNEKRTSAWGHSDAKDAAVKAGRRILFLTQNLAETPESGELLEIMNRSKKLGDVLERTSEVKIVTSGKFELRLRLQGRKALRLSSILSAPGSWGAVPDYSEAGIAPIEDETHGIFRTDGMIVSLGKVDSPVDLEFERGNLTRISGGIVAEEFRKIIFSYEASARVLAEIGFGTNHLRKVVRGEFDDKKMLGATHIALGDNHTFGGNNRADIHIDCMAIRPEVFFDGKRFDFSVL